MASKFLAVSLLLSLSCATTSESASGGAAAPAGDAPRVVSGLPDFELSSVAGDTLRLSDHVGREVVVLAFWDTWCEPCKTELPLLDKMYRAHKDQGLLVIAISMDDTSTTMQVAPYAHESGFAFPVLLDTSGRAAGLYNTHKTAPYTVIIGRDGKIASESAGFEPAAIKPMEERIEKLLASAGT